MNKEWHKVKLFHEKFGHPSADFPIFLDKERAKNRSKWIMEEITEFLVAQNIYEQADAMIDLIYFALGTLVEMGIKPDDLFEIVQDANMSKLGIDGKSMYNKKDGKIIKPGNWKDPAPKIKYLIDKLIGESDESVI